MEFPRFPIGDVVEMAVKWLMVNLADFFDGISLVLSSVMGGLADFLNLIPWPIVLIVVGLIAWKAAGWRIALFAVLGLFVIGSFQLWEEAIDTIALMATSVFLSLSLGIPTGILTASNDTIDRVIRPVLDTMQTLPAYVYLIPAIMFFGIGDVPAVMATLVFAIPPVVRLTNLGIRQVDPEVIEAAKAFGSTPNQLLIKVQIPLALPSIMAGINQTIMLALSMVVVAGLIGSGGLGRTVVIGLNQVDISMGFEGGLSIVLIAMILDRVSTSLGKTINQTRGVG